MNEKNSPRTGLKTSKKPRITKQVTRSAVSVTTMAGERRKLQKAAPQAVPGVPFKKGEDPRRNLAGARSRDALGFGRAFNEALANGGDPAELAAVLWKKALSGVQWAAEMILDRLMGRPLIQARIRPPENITYRIIYANPKDVPASPFDGDPGPSRCVQEFPAESTMKAEARPDPPASTDDESNFE